METTPVHTVVQPGPDGELYHYPKGQEPALPGVRTEPLPDKTIEALESMGIRMGGKEPAASTPTPAVGGGVATTVEAIAGELGLRKIYSVKDRGADAYSGTMPLDTSLPLPQQEPFFYLALDNAAIEYVRQEGVAIMEAQLQQLKPEKDENQSDADPEAEFNTFLQDLRGKATLATELADREAALNDYILAQSWRGSRPVRDWQDLLPELRSDIAGRIAKRATLSRTDLQSLATG